MRVSGRGGMIYAGFRDMITDHLRNKVRVPVLSNISCLDTLTNAWNDYTAKLDRIKILYRASDHVQQHNADSVDSLGLIIFSDEVIRYGNISDHLRNNLLNLIMAERRGETVNRSAINTACQMLVALRIGSLYEDGYEDFEGLFLQQSTEFYRTESQKLLTKNSASVYAHKVEVWISEESDRAKQCLDASTKPKIVQVLEVELISRNMQTIVEMENSGVAHMLDNDHVEDLSRLYRLLRRVPSGLKTMTDCLSSYLRKQGEALVQEPHGAAAAAAAGNEKGDCKSPSSAVQSLLDLRDRFDRLLLDAFDGDRHFEQVIAADFEYFLNLNANVPKCLSLFIDDKLKKGARGMTQAEIKQVLEKSMILFRFLQEKDVFKWYYKQHLAKRLLLKQSVSDNAEKNMISKLQADCGRQFTNKLQGMVNDIQQSATLMEQYKQHREQPDSYSSSDGVDLYVRVLTTWFWPVPACNSICILPKSAYDAFERFKQSYLNKHRGRKISLQPQLGSADLHATFYGRVSSGGTEDREQPTTSSLDTADAGRQTQSRKHILCVSTYQMCVLMLFNKKESYTFKDITSQTALPEKDLKRAVQSLAMGESSQCVLTRHSADGNGASTAASLRDIEADDVFHVNDFFTSRLYRVKIQSVSAKGKSEVERQGTRNKVDEDRKHEIEAAESWWMEHTVG